MSPMIGTIAILDVFCLDEVCSLGGVEKEVLCCPNYLFEPRLATFITSFISRRPESLDMGGGVDVGLDDIKEAVTLWRFLLCGSNMF